MIPAPLNNAFPQRGIIMTVSGQTAQVYMPLTKYETDFMDSTVTLDPSNEGHEAIVVFINGDRNQGVIVGVIP